MKKMLFTIAILMIFVSSHAQNVGIGTNAPAEKLEVAGNVKADTIKPGAFKLTPNAGDGKVFTSDAQGNGSWQNSNTSSGTNGNVGYGVWGDCATNGNISEYQPVGDETTTGAPGSYFGYSVSVSGNYAIIGSPFDDVGANADQGSASIYQNDGTGWVLMQKITDATGAANDYFGFSVSISGIHAIVGAQLDDVGANTNQGSASIYEYNGSSWVLMQKITDATGAANDYFGYSVSISGNNAIVGAQQDDVGANLDQGSASIYQFNGTNWGLMAKLTDANGAANDYFGGSVSITGSRVIIGAYGDDVGANADQGSASVYQYNVTSWVPIQKITDAFGAANDNFGASVSISGNYAIVGAYNDDVGTNINQGAASIYQFNGLSWVLMQKIVDATGSAGDYFGSSVSISGNYAIVGTQGDYGPGNYAFQGSATIYQRIGAGWQKLQYITDPGGNGNDYAGSSISIDATSKRFIIGCFGFADGAGKVLFGKIN